MFLSIFLQKLIVFMNLVSRVDILIQNFLVGPTEFGTTIIPPWVVSRVQEALFGTFGWRCTAEVSSCRPWRLIPDVAEWLRRFTVNEFTSCIVGSNPTVGANVRLLGAGAIYFDFL
jgi:hypothetical protein